LFWAKLRPHRAKAQGARREPGLTRRAAAGPWRRPPERAKRAGMSRTATIYGIKSCDTMKKARDWLAGHGVEVGFHDYKVSGIDTARLEAWADKLGWEVLLNRAGTTFKALPDEKKQGLDQAKAIALMLEQPSMIKRPVLDLGDGRLLVGFKPDVYEAAFR
jgi:arsenate reductase